MAKYCEYCGLELAPEDRICPNCGAPAPGAEPAQAERPAIPGTIQELKDFARSYGMPLEQMRFFIGRNESSPRAFGIYQDRTGDFIVYKNKSDGTRAIRYRGPDEAAAVREIYRKLQDEVALRRGTQAVYRSADSMPVRSRGSAKLSLPIILLVAIGVLILFFTSRFSREPSQGYYLYDDVYYYYQDSDWFYYSRSMENWVAAGEVDEPLQKNPNKYFSSQTYLNDYDVESFSSSPYYEGSDAEQDWDSDDEAWNYDYDSWDAGDTDWDSNW